MYKYLKGIPLKIIRLRIELEENVKHVSNIPYRINKKYNKEVKEEVKNLLDMSCIYLVEKHEWFSLIMIAKKKNGKLWICIEFKNINSVMEKDSFPIIFIEEVLESVIGREIYSITNGFLGYNQIQIHLHDHLKITFSTELGSYE